MKVNPQSRAKKAAAAINQVRVAKSSFTYNFKDKKDELVDMLKKSGCPYPIAVAASLVRQGLVKRDSGVYTFMTDSPIHFSVIIGDINKAATAALDAANKQANKAKPIGKPEDAISEVKVFNDVDVINYLKAKGYRILRPITNFEEC